MFRTPKRELLERLARVARDGLRRERGRLVSEVVLDPEVVADSAERAVGGGYAERGLVRDGAEHDRGNVAWVSESDAALVGGVESLNGLVDGGNVRTDDDVNVALGFLRVLHGNLLLLVREDFVRFHQQQFQR